MSKFKDKIAEWKSQAAPYVERWNHFTVGVYDFFAGLSREKVKDACSRSWQYIKHPKNYLNRETGPKLLAFSQRAWNKTLNILGAIHQFIARVVLGISRAIGRLFGHLPWGPRYSVVLLIGLVLTAFVIKNASIVLLLKNPPSLEAFEDRNRNTIVFSDEPTPNVVFNFYDLTENQRALIDKLEKSLNDASAKLFAEQKKSNPYAENDGSQTFSVCEDEHLKLLSEISGVSRKYLTAGDAMRVERREESYEIKFIIEYDSPHSRTTTRETHTRILLNPTPEQRKLLSDMPAVSEAGGDIFNPQRVHDLEALVKAPNIKKDDNDNREIKFNAKNLIVREFSPVHADAVIRIFITKLQLGAVDPMEVQVIKETIEDKFESDNTTPTGATKQYSAFRKADVKNIVSKRIAATNEMSLKVAKRAHEQEILKYTQEADQEIKTLKKDRRRLKKADEQAIRDSYMEKVKPLTYTVLERKVVPDSEITTWFEQEYKDVQFNADNSRFEPTLLELIYNKNLTADFDSWANIPAKVVFVLLALAIVLGLISYPVKALRKPSYYVMVTAGVTFAVYWAFSIYFAFDLPDQLLGIVTKKEAFTSVERNDIWFDYIWLWWPGLLYSFFAWFPLLISSARTYFGVKRTDAAVMETGDAWAFSLKAQGKNGSLFRSFYWCFGYHFFILILLPVLLECCNGWKDDEYKVPKGDGGGQVQQVVQVKKKPKKKKKRYLLNPNSNVIFDTPVLPDEELLAELDEQTESTYVTSNGSMGPNKKGGKPGWPLGMEDGKVRFIRLKYSGGDWDQDMGKGADYNLLIKIHEYAGFNIANETEAISVDELAHNFRKKGKKPPFLFITGRGSINFTNKEIKILRDYLLKDGGMLFADNGGGHFHNSFVNLMKRILPNHTLVDIANDDIIYQQPFHFPNGAPSLFHHSGRRALGIKNNGRWVVFYHQGDINDAWKTGGSGLSKQQQDQAFKLGANVVAYAFGEYLKAVFGE